MKFLSYAMPAAKTNSPAGSAPIPGAVVEVRIEKLVHGGAGLARLAGQVVLVRGVLPGETVRLELVRQRAGVWEARLLEVLEPSPQRTEPACPYFGRCGGCQLQHCDYSLQLEIKRAVLGETLRRVGKFEPPGDAELVAAQPWAYRNRIALHLAGRRLGYFQNASRRLCSVDRCLIASETLNRVLKALAGMLADPQFPSFLRSLEIFASDQQVQLNVTATEGGRRVSRRFFEWCRQAVPELTTGPVDYFVAGETYRVGARSFFQVNRLLVDQLVARALEGAEGCTALDLYAGVGLFSLPMARRFKHVVAVEAGRSAAADLAFNVARAGLSVEVHETTAGAYLAALERAPDFVLADPPRAGLGPQVVHELLRLRPQQLTVVSCEPATLARDLGPLIAGGYKLARLLLVDLFPQTYHIEAVAHLRL